MELLSSKEIVPIQTENSMFCDLSRVIGDVEVIFYIYLVLQNLIYLHCVRVEAYNKRNIAWLNTTWGKLDDTFLCNLGEAKVTKGDIKQSTL